MKEYLIRAQKINERIDELAAISDDTDCISRIYCTEAFIKSREKVLSWMNAAGLKTRIDNIGNARGVLLSENPNAKTFVIASHIDTVMNAGKFDGPLGVITGLSILEDLIQEKTLYPFNIELIAFCDEEGVRFHTAFLGSKAVAGSFDPNQLDKKDSDEITLREVIESTGGDPTKIAEDAIAKDNWLGYFEIHIEQGPVLYEKNIPVAIVTSIAGQRRIEITFTGVGGHAGTIPMNMRNDALCAAAEFILAAEKFAVTPKHNVVVTTGKLEIPNAASNVIAGIVKITLDIRSADESYLSDAYEALNSICEEICFKRKLYFEWQLIQQTNPVTCDEKMRVALAQSIEDSGYEVIEITSGAGHDAVPVSEVSPVAMLFVKCTKGISHNPLEAVELEDIAAALKVAENFIHNFTFG